VSRSSNPPTGFLTVADVAQLTRQCEKTVRRAIKNRDLPAQRFGRSVRISEQAYVHYVKTRQMWTL